jgi:molybdopterin-guanine dinucleotide biosynthesis protein A
MGRDKASLRFGDETLAERVRRIVSEVVPEVVLVAREGQALPHGLDAVRDAAEGLGPLAGIAAGLRAIRGSRALVVSCDLPLLRPVLARRLLDLARGHDACVPLIDGFAMTTCAVYTAALAARAQALVDAGRLRLLFLVEEVKTRFVTADELGDVDPLLESFHDCDTPERYVVALRRAGLTVP